MFDASFADLCIPHKTPLMSNASKMNDETEKKHRNALVALQ